MLTCLSFAQGEAGVTLGDDYRYFYLPYEFTVIYVTASPSVDDTGLTIDLNAAGTDSVIAAVDASDKDVPGTWKSTHVGGTNAPVTIPADSLCSFDANAAAANTAVLVHLWGLVGSIPG